MSNENSDTKNPRGFAAMDRAVVSAIARKGGIISHKLGKAHEFTSETGRAAGKLGGGRAHRSYKEKNGGLGNSDE